MDLANILDNVCVGTFGDKGIPGTLANIIHLVYLAIKIAIPVLLIIFGSIDLGKAITAGKEDEIKKAQSSFIKKLIVGILVFLVFTIVEFVFNVGTDKNGETASNDSAWKCACELLKGAGNCD